MTAEKTKTDIESYTFPMAAFHFDEMDRSQWEALSLEQRLSWYYDKTHDLIERAKDRFDRHLTAYTEELGQDKTIRNIARFIDPDWKNLCPPVHVNSRKWWKEEAEKHEAVRRDMLAPDC